MALCAIVTACGGGGGGGGGSVAAPLPTPSPFVFTTTANYTGTSLNVDLLGGTGGRITLPAGTGAPAIATITISGTPPSGFAALQSALRTPRSWSGQLPRLYITLSFDAAITVHEFPAFTLGLNVPGLFNVPTPTSPTFLAFYDTSVTPNAWNFDLAGQGTVASNTVTFASKPATYTFGVNQVYDFVYYESPGASPSPSPVPTPTPSPTPVGQTPSPSPSPTATPTASPTPSATPAPVPGALTITPTVLQVSPGGSNTFLIQDYLGGGAPYTGTFVKSGDTCTGATAATTYATSTFDPAAPGPTQTVTVTGGNLGGSCVLTFTDLQNPAAPSAFVNVTNYGAGGGIH